MSTVNRIFLLSRVIPHHSIGGMQAIAWDLAKRFQLSGRDVAIITSQVESKPTSFVDDGIRVHAIAGTDWRRPNRVWWAESVRVFKRISGDEPCLALSVSAAGFGLLRDARSRASTTYVMQAHGTSLGELASKLRSLNIRSIATTPRNLFWLAKDLTNYRKFDAVAAVGPEVFKALRRFPYSWFLPANKVHMVPNGVDTALFCPDLSRRDATRRDLGIGKHEKILITACRLDEQKGLHLSLDAFEALHQREKDVRYLIVGDGPLRSALSRRVERGRLRTHVQLLGAVSRERLAALLAASDSMLFTSTRVEGLPLNVLEALASGLIAVISRHICDRALFGNNAIGVDPVNAEEVAAVLTDVLSRPRSDFTLLPQRLSLDHCATAYMQLFERLELDNA